MPQKDPETRRLYMQAWRVKNPDKVRANDLRDRERQKEYQRAHLPRYAELQRQWRANNPKDVMVINARARAKKKGYPCTITVADISWVTHCPIFGIELDYNTTPTGNRLHNKRDAFPTLDKRDPSLGYVPGNVFVLSHKANRLKQDATGEQLEALLTYMRHS
jgi:hypothetical protein